MGASLSRTASRTARRYPTRPQEPSATSSRPPGDTPTPSTPPTSPPTSASTSDAAYTSMLRSVGAVSIPDAARSVDLAGNTNPQLRTLERRTALADGRDGLRVEVLREALRMRDEDGMGEREIERSLKLKSGSVGRLKRVGNTEGGVGWVSSPHL